MGIPLYPPGTQAGNCACFPDDVLPTQAFISVAGCNYPGNPPLPFVFSPNGIHSANYDVNCAWTTLIVAFITQWATIAGKTRIQVQDTQFNPGFDCLLDAPCAIAGANKNINENGPNWWGGFGIIAFLRRGTDNSLSDIADSIGVPVEEDTYCDFWPVETTHMVTRFANVPENINILVKTENP